MTQLRGAILDIDGTLIDSNDAHAHAWVEAMAKYGHDVPFDKVRPLIGMGGDKVLPETVNVSKDSEEGKKISKSRKEIFKSRYLSSLKPFPHALDLLQHMHDCGLKLVIATSAEPDELHAMLDIIGPDAEGLFEKQTTSKDAKNSKPDPDIMHVALERIGYSAHEVVMIGDTAYDVEAAQKAAIKTIALRSGGWSDQDLAGAIALYDSPADLLAHYDESPLATGI